VSWDGLNPPYATITADPPWPYDERQVGWADRKIRAPLPYSTMPVPQIAALPVAEIAQPGSHLYLWTTQHYLWDARDVAGSWGWDVKPGRIKILTWCKQPVGIGPGGNFSNTTEFVLFCRRPVGALIRAAREEVGWTAKELHRRIRHGVGSPGVIANWELDLRPPMAADWTALRALLPALAHLPDFVPSPIRTPSTWFQWSRGHHSAKPPAFLDLVERVSPAPRVELFARAQRLGWDSWGWGYENASSIHAV